MKIYFIVWVLTLLTGVVLDVDKDILKLILSTGVATLFRLFFEITYNKIKLTFTRTTMIVIVSIFLPYALFQLISSIKFLEKVQLFTLFVIGAAAIDITEIILKKLPQKLSEILDLIPELVREKIGLNKKTEENDNI